MIRIASKKVNMKEELDQKELAAKEKIAFDLFREHVKNSDTVNFTIIAYSMSPILVAGNEVAVKYCAPEKLNIGDIVVFKHNDCLYAHRYIHRAKHSGNMLRFVTKGDNLLDLDNMTVTAQDLFGKVVSIKKSYGEIKLAGFSWKMYGYFLAVISFLQAYTFRFLRHIKQLFIKDIIVIPRSSRIKKILVFPLPFCSKIGLFVWKLLAAKK